MAAGLGTRMNSARAKVLHCLGGRPLVSYPLHALRQIGVDPIVVVVGYQAEAVRQACAPFAVRCAVQAQQKGTGDAARAAAAELPDFHGDLLILNGDLPFLRPATLTALVAAHRQAGAAVSLVTATVAEPTGLGRIIRDTHGAVARIVEERDAGAAERAIREINVGVYCAAADFLFDALAHLRPLNAQGELYLTDIIAAAVAQGLPIGDAAALPHEADQISSRADLADREKTMRDEINRKWMAAGVTFEDPATAYIGPDVTIGRDTILGPNVTLRGNTRVGEGCRFDGTTLITDATIGDAVHVKFGVVITEAVIEAGAQVGPLAHLRAGTRLGPRVHIGDFVETKNAVIGAGTKAMHLAYLGDTEIGQDTNIGAGTITCNYDGFRKQRTLIGDRVQIGSDTTLVAPVTVADDAYVATATTVRRDVPAGALVFNSRDQMHRPGWVAARRAREAAPGGAAPRRPKMQAVAGGAKLRGVAKKPAAGKKRVVASPPKSARRK